MLVWNNIHAHGSVSMFRLLNLLVIAVTLTGLGCNRTPSTTASSQPVVEQIQPTPAAPQELIVPALQTNESFVGPLADAYNRLDPSVDGWDSEAIGASVNAQLSAIAAQFVAAQPKLDGLIAKGFSSIGLVGATLTEHYRDQGMIVTRSDGQSEAVGENSLSHYIGQLQQQIPADLHVKFKLYRVIPGDQVQTRAYFHAYGQTAQGRLEINADWLFDWTNTSSPSSAPLLKKIRVEKLEVVESLNSTAPLFADRTDAILGGDPAYEQQLRFGTDHWRSRICREFGLDVVANHGLAIGDVNGDMLEDLYVCQQGGLPNRLFLQQPDGTLKDASSASGANWLKYSASALLIDLDNDGDKDLVVAHEFHVLLMRNDGSGSFYTEHIAPCRAQTFSLAAADYDVDGDLDVYCCGYNRQRAEVRAGAMGSPMPYHDAQNGGANILLRNDGHWSFVNATAEAGLEQNNNRFSFAASWEDFDNDGDLDLYVSNDYGRNNLYQNDGAKFKDVAAELNVEDMSAGMSVTWADANRDGWMDFYVSNMFSAAGNRITYQRQFKDEISGEVKQQFQRHARGNSLFLADGQGGFRDVSEAAGITMGRWAWGSKFCDLNNDGWQDIVINNGFISTEDTGDL